MATRTPHSNPLDNLIEHHRWATRNILDACAHLADDESRQKFPIGPGSLHVEPLPRSSVIESMLATESAAS